MALKKCCRFLPRMESAKYTIHRMEIRYSAKFITVISPRQPTAGQDTPIYCHYTPSSGDSGAKCIILSPLYPRARRQRGKTHQFIAIIPPRPVTAGQNASFYHRYTPVPAGGGARHTNLSPLYPRARLHRGIAPQFPAAMPLATNHDSLLIL